MATLNPPIRDWQGKRVWVVGASAGIGKALAESLTQAGAVVVATARRADALAELSPPPAHCIVADISKEASLKEALAAIESSVQDIDVVFWVAGVYHPMTSQQLDLAGVRDTFEVNLLSAYCGLSLMLARWLPQGAQASHLPARPARTRHWVWVSSVAGYRGLPKAAAYGASKAALTYLAETNYLELRASGIAVSVVSPGFVQTRLTAKNEFQMPAIITPEEAAAATLKGMARGEFEIHYPKRFTRVMRLLRILPYWLYFPLAARALPKD
jgi:NAD(P)-dependent dehydrogenase (short-subunit alcohol dehydrogenase family)